jgi:hypothetical protein
MEMVRDWYGFHRGIATHTGSLRFYLGYSGLIDQGGSLYTSEDYLHWGMISGVVHLLDCVFAWGTQEDSVRQRHSVHVSVLAKVA